MFVEIGPDPIIVEQSVVDIEEEDYAMRCSHKTYFTRLIGSPANSPPSWPGQRETLLRPDP
jgi:hypothetical protein